MQPKSMHVIIYKSYNQTKQILYLIYWNCKSSPTNPNRYVAAWFCGLSYAKIVVKCSNSVNLLRNFLLNLPLKKLDFSFQYGRLEWKIPQLLLKNRYAIERPFTW